MEYSTSPQDFQEKFKKSQERERELLWEAEFSKLKSGQFFEFDQIEDVILESDLHAESFQQHRAQYEAFESMIPKLSPDRVKESEAQLIEDSSSLIDYLYCSHGFYSRLDRWLAKSRAILKRYI